MCGLAGIWQMASAGNADLRRQVECMANALRHRGPDAEGSWADESAGVALGFRRLSIIDLSPQGNQPMCSEAGRYVIAFNGEVYNSRCLRAELEPLGHCFRGHSDTEVMLAAIEQWGLEASVQRFVGMFAFALWDRHHRRLSLVRDRLGIKPLYYGWTDGIFFFASELKALRMHPAFRPQIDRGALSLFLRHNHVPDPYSIYQHVYKIPPGCILTLACRTDRPSPTPYWSLKDITEQGLTDPYTSSEGEAITRLNYLLCEAVKLRMISDVPLGAFLSGGIDSSVVVALMQAQSGHAVKTFSIGFAEDNYDEAHHARRVAEHLETDHNELYVTPSEAQSVIPQLPDMYDEPFADSSQIPTFLVSRLARSHVTVSLSGDGGDELFGGYERYVAAETIWRYLHRLPAGLRRQGARALLNLETPLYDRWLGLLAPITRRYTQASIGQTVHKLAEVLPATSADRLYHLLVSQWKEPARVVQGGFEPPTIFTDPDRQAALSELFQRMMYFDAGSYLPNDILTKLDRASMAVSLEARVPLLDHRLVEFVSRLPLSLKTTRGEPKRILRHVLYRYVPPSLVDRPKMGFGVPIDVWLRGPLREWAESLLEERRLHREGFFDPTPIRQAWSEHLAGRRSRHYQLWNVLMFQCWLERWGD